jgi:D-xylose transport system permease protein
MADNPRPRVAAAAAGARGQAAAAAAEIVPSRREFLRRFLQGDLASLRVLLGVAVIWAIFQSQNDRFLTAVNLTNLLLQITAVGLISVGVVYVLMLGEIDLSVGAVSGLCAAVMAVLNVKHGWNPYLAIAAGVLAGTAIGVIQGFLFSRFGIPSFVVTLAGLLAWQGALLQVLGETGTVNITDPKIVGLANTFYSDTVGWIVAAVVIGTFAGVTLIGSRRRVAAGLEAEPVAVLAFRIGVVAAAVIATIAVLNSDRGLPLAVLIFLGFVAGMEYVLQRTKFGRHVFAVGGNAEAARRAGISLNRIRIVVFGISGTMAAIGGILAASRLLAVSQTSGGNDLLLFAIAGPVIAGTSLFGGRGSVWTALLGALVIGSISNGMDLLAYQSSVKFMVTGGVLLAAVLVDSIARRQRQAAGRV